MAPGNNPESDKWAISTEITVNWGDMDALGRGSGLEDESDDEETMEVLGFEVVAFTPWAQKIAMLCALATEMTWCC